MNPLKSLEQYQQSIWLDYIHCDLISKGKLAKMVGEDGVKGVTSNPSIFQKAIAGSNAYDQKIEEILAKNKDIESYDLYEELAVADIQAAADVLRAVYDKTNGQDGFVSLEVSPELAHDTQGTIDQARHLWQKVNRPNLMIKVPATKEGIPAIETLIGENINVNVTLIFSRENYREVAHAYIRGLEKSPDKKVSSVASFFISRVDSAVDKLLQDNETGKTLLGKIAIANSKIAYQDFLEIFDEKNFGNLKNQGAYVQRPLWASTSTKNPAYPDTLYVDELIGKDTVNTLPPDTLEAYRHHGQSRNSIEENIDKARHQLDQLKKLDIDLGDVTEKLQKDGLEAFCRSFEDLIESLRKKLQVM